MFSILPKKYITPDSGSNVHAKDAEVQSVLRYWGHIITDLVMVDASGVSIMHEISSSSSNMI